MISLTADVTVLKRRRKVLEGEQPGHDMLITHTELGSQVLKITGNERKITIN